MNIQPANTYNLNTNFKATYPVMHWVAETNGSYAPITNMDLVKKLQGKIIRMLNKPLKDSVKKMNPVEQNLRAYIGGCDSAYRVLPRVRSFYNRITGGFGRYTPVSYIISGKDVEVFDNFLDKLLFHGAAVILKRRSPEEFRGLSETFRQIMAWPSPIAVDRPDRLNVISEKILRAANEDALK